MRNGIQFKHYVISAHAFQRFTERTGKPVEELFEHLEKAVMFDMKRAHRVSWWRSHRAAERDGAYILKSGRIHFIVKPVEAGHVVKTVLVQERWNH
jgi:hypothetical protein